MSLSVKISSKSSSKSLLWASKMKLAQLDCSERAKRLPSKQPIQFLISLKATQKKSDRAVRTIKMASNR